MDGGTEVYGTLVSDIQTDVSVTGKPVYLTASGNEITVDVKKGNMTNPVVTMSPIQNLNGYDNPWVGSAGKNKCSVNSGNNTVISTNLQAGTWTFSMKSTGSCGFNLKENSNAGTTITSVASYSSNEGITFTLTEPCNVFINGFSSEQGKTFVELTSEFQIESGSTATSFAPYENICPITARTKTEISVNGSVITREYGQEIYGGTDEIAEGVVTNSWVELNITSPNNIRRNNAKQYYINSTIAFEVNSTNIVSDKFRTASIGSGVCFLNQNGDIRFNTVDEYDSAEDLFNTIGNIKFVAKVQTPQEILTTKGYVPLDKGTNEITVSNNDIITFDYCSTLAGKISGTLSYIENGLAPSGYLSGSGNFLALHLDSEDWDIYTSVKVGLYPSEGSGMVEILSDEEKICVGKITSNDQVFMVESTDGTLTKTDVYSLSDLVLETE